MHNVWIIVKREYLERVRTKAFWITTILVPALMYGVIVLPTQLMMKQKGTAKRIAILASDADFGHAIERSLSRPIEGVNKDEYTVEVVTPGTAAQQEEAKRKVENGQLDGMLVATDDAVAAKKLTYSSRSSAGLIETGIIGSAIRMAYLQRQLAGYGIAGDKLESLLNEKFDLDTVRISETGAATKVSSRANFFIALVLVMILYMSIILHGVAVMRSVLEEKTSRVMEVLLASATPKQLMAGKIIGVGSVGLTQMAVWYGSGALVGAVAQAQASAITGSVQLPTAALALFPLFFVLGYFLYSSLYAMIGAMVNSEQEAQQIQFLVLMPLLLSTVIMVPAITSPASPMVVGVSLFPFCTPLVMFARVAAQGAPTWQIVVSLAGVLLATWVTTIVASRIYRVGILMYGKRPTLPELIKWFKYA
jgi:ABC-2 type transport system permease protein